MDDEEQYRSIWSKNIPAKEQFKIMKRLFTFVKPFKWTFIIAVVGAFLVSVINMLLPRLLQYFMDNFLTKQTATVQIILGFAAIYAIGSILKAILQYIYYFMYSMGSERALEDVRRTIFRKLHNLGMRYFDQTPAGSIVSRVTNDTSTLADFWNVFATLIIALFSMITALVAMWTTNHTATFIVMAFIPILLFFVWLYTHFSSKLYRRFREKLSQINVKLNESIEGITVIQQFRQEKRIDGEFEQTNKEQLDTRNAMIRMNSFLLSPITSLLYSVALTFVLLYFGFPLHETFVPAGVVYAFANYTSNFFNPMADLMDSLTFFQDGVVAGSRIFRILDNDELAPAQENNPAAKITEGRIEFKHVNFSYDGKNSILNDVSFTVEPGQTLGIVGHTGSGKSSIINVMMRFYEYYEGEILIDGYNIKEFTKDELRAKLGLVLQDPFMFYGDVSSNIRLFNDKITDEQVRAAAEFVQADRFIDKLPKKYHARVIEGGAQFSGGQRQLLSFARTVVTNPKILVLDEATANIDTETESLIQDGLKKIRNGRTTLAIAHRLSTIADANQIIVLDQGRIVESGTHDELLAHKGYYYDLYTLQQTQV